MKIRCEQNSIRLRLRRSELVQLRAEKWLGSGVHFPNGQVLQWDLVLEDDLQDMQADLQPNRICLRVPFAMALQWMDTNDVAMECFIRRRHGPAPFN